MKRALFAFACSLVAACATGARVPGATAFRITCDRPEAIVLVDDVMIGTVQEWSDVGHFIRPGHHRVEVRALGYYAHLSEIDARDGAAIVFVAKLRPEIDD